MQRLTGDPGPLSEQKIACPKVRAIAAQSVIRNIFSDPYQCVGHNLPADVSVCEHCLRMEAGGVLSLLDVNCVVRE